VQRGVSVLLLSRATVCRCVGCAPFHWDVGHVALQNAMSYVERYTTTVVVVVVVVVVD